MDRKQHIARLVEHGFEQGFRELDEMTGFVRGNGVPDATDDEILEAVAGSIPGLMSPREKMVLLGTKSIFTDMGAMTPPHDELATPEAGYEVHRRERRRRWLWIIVYTLWIVVVTAFVTVRLVEAWK